MANQDRLPIEDKFYRAAQAVEPKPEFSEDLWSQISNQPKPVSGFSLWQRMSLRPAWSAALVVIILVLGAAVANPQQVMAAVNNLLGYLPGIGFVQNDSSTLYLPKPVTVEQNGVKLTVYQAVADAKSTRIAYRFEGLPQTGADGMATCVYDDNRLRTSGARVFPPTGGESHNNEASLEFWPLPAGVKHATLLVSTHDPEPNCSAPAQWTVELDFGPIPPDVTLMPVIEEATPQPARSTSAPIEPAKSAEDSAVTNVHPDIQFVIDRAAVLEDGYLVEGHTTWADKSWETLFPDVDAIQIKDATGKIVSTGVEGGTTDNNFSFKILGKDLQGPFTIQFDSVSVIANLKDGPTLSFDAGVQPKVGQSWTLDQTLEVFGQKINIRSVRAIHTDIPNGDASSTSETANGYDFDIQDAAAIKNLTLQPTGGQKTRGVYGNIMPKGDSGISLEMIYPDGLPTGKLTYQVAGAHFQLRGPWQIQWQPSTPAQ